MEKSCFKFILLLLCLCDHMAFCFGVNGDNCAYGVTSPLFLWPVVFDPPHSTQSVSLAHPARGGGGGEVAFNEWLEPLGSVTNCSHPRSLVWRRLSRTRRLAAGGPTGCCAPGAQLGRCSQGPVGRWSPERQMSSVFFRKASRFFSVYGAPFSEVFLTDMCFHPKGSRPSIGRVEVRRSNTTRKVGDTSHLFCFPSWFRDSKIRGSLT